MKLSFNLLSEFIDLSDMKIADLADLLTMKTCEVEGYTEVRPDLGNFIVAEVKSVEKHPDADKLKICQVFDGKNIVQIVTGAPNVAAGKKYPLAPIGVTMPGGMQIKPAKLRGIDSQGMLCSASELEIESFVLNLEGHEDGLLTLPDSMTTGSTISQSFHLNDFELEIDNKSITHRPDLWGHYGFAREISSLTGKSLKNIELVDVNRFFDQASGKEVNCSIKNNSAIAYSWVNISNIKVSPSPLEIQARLIVTGMRPINNIVDISNYVMLELGQPNHAFDRSTIKDEIQVCFSKKGEKLELLDSRVITTPENIVLIKDGETPVALGGVMGGKTTEVSNTTGTIFLESATFHRADIRKAVSEFGIRTEASQRFEKGQNPENSLLGIHRFITLLNNTGQKIKTGKIQTQKTEEFKQNTIVTSISFIKTKLGHPDLDADTIVKILDSLSLECSLTGDDLVIKVPVFRSYFDIEIPEDIVEEIGRVIGYNQIKPEPLMVPCKVPDYKNHMRELEHLLREKMSSSYQFTEVYNYAFHSQKDIDLDKRFSQNTVNLLNPLNQELGFMRISPLPRLLQNIADNFKKHSDLRFYELERIFIPKEGQKDEKSLPYEKYFLAGIYYSNADSEIKLKTIQSLLADLLVSIGVPLYNQGREALSEPVFHPGRAGKIMYKEKPLVKWGELHPELTSGYKINERVVYFEIMLEDILNIFILSQVESGYVPVIKYPAAEFEFTVLMDERDPFNNLLNTIGMPEGLTVSDKTVIETAEHLTTYTGDPVPEGKKAVSVKIRWRNSKRTIQHEELKDLQENLVLGLQKAGFSLR